MAAIAGDSQRAFGYKRAAKAVLRIDRDITPLVTANTFKAIPGIGPTTDRIARELIVDGRSAFVERAVRESGKEEEEQIRQPILDKYELEGSPYYSTARLWDDGILDPAQTRNTLALALSASFNAPVPPPKFGVFRM